MKRVLFATSEIYPLVKTGGLGDVSYSLPQALLAEGVDVRVIVPGYGDVKQGLSNLRALETLSGFMLPDNTQLLEGVLPNTKIKVWVIDCPELFDREGGPYLDSMKQEWPDNAQRFAVFCRAIAELALARTQQTWTPDVVHCNDWQTGLAPALISLADNPPATVFTIHNLAYQGNFSKAVFDSLCLPSEWWSIDGVEFYHNMSFLKAGIVFSDKVTTVSPTYAKEILSKEYGFGMDGLLRHHQGKLSGVLNGVDYQIWNPETDEYLKFNYGAESLPEKIKNKLDIQRRFGLRLTKGTPLLGVVSRLVHQKGIDMLVKAIQATKDDKLQWVILGSGEDEFESAIQALAESNPDKVAFVNGYDESLAHQIEASADIFVMPSRYEPCGLNQIYSLRYGTLPLVRATGGLADTVVDINDPNSKDIQGTGFVFADAGAAGLIDAINKAGAFYRRKKKWRQAQLNAMAKDYSWLKSADAYLALYESAQSGCTSGQLMTE